MAEATLAAGASIINDVRGLTADSDLAAVVAGAHPDFAAAQARMTSLKKVSYKPKAVHQRTYDRLYGLYRKVHDSFGGVKQDVDLSTLMKELLDLKAAAAR